MLGMLYRTCQVIGLGLFIPLGLVWLLMSLVTYPLVPLLLGPPAYIIGGQEGLDKLGDWHVKLTFEGIEGTLNWIIYGEAWPDDLSAGPF